MEAYEMEPYPDWDDIVKIGWVLLGVVAVVVTLIVLATKCC